MQKITPTIIERLIYDTVAYIQGLLQYFVKLLFENTMGKLFVNSRLDGSDVSQILLLADDAYFQPFLFTIKIFD